MKASWNLGEGVEIAEGRTVLEPLGGGRRYEVYLAWDERLLCLTVAKLLRPDRAEDERALRALRREAELLRWLAHPAIVRTFDAVLEGPYPHLLLEHFDAPTLRAAVGDEGPLPPDQVVAVALDVLGALHFLAGQGIVHLDVKPSNVVLAVPGRLIDFGSARTVEEGADRSLPIGTAPYMAPEQCEPGGAFGPVVPASDVWGCGATLWWALTGGPPFPEARGGDEPRYPQLEADAPPLPDYVPAGVAAVVRSMLARRPEDRPAPAAAVAALEPLAIALRDG